ncbi:unnamed protein product [Rhizopus stolonifer]
MPPNTEINQVPSTRVFIDEEKFQEHVKKGDSVFIFESKVYKVNNFIFKHPGGEAVMRSALGRDVTDEIRSMHPPKVYEKMIHLYYIGDYLPDITKTNFRKAVQKKSRQPEEQLMATWEGGMSIKAYNAALDELNKIHSTIFHRFDKSTRPRQHQGERGLPSTRARNKGTWIV